METNLHRDVKLLRDLITTLDDAAREQTEGTLESDLIALQILEDCRRDLGTICTDLTNRLARAMPKQLVVPGVGVFERHKKKSRTAWDKDDLLRAVKDSVLIGPDRQTGEIETHLDKVLHVWNLGTPRTTALRARGINPDDYCHTEDAGWQIRVS
jgi:hypothetical protein